MDLTQLFAAHEAITAAWPAAARALYQTFTDHLVSDAAFTITLGKGGLSYYHVTAQRRLFICHVNALPRGREDGPGFADFRTDVLAPLVDVAAVLAGLRTALGDDITIREGKVWCSLHFPRARAAEVADAFRTELVGRVA